MRYLPLGWSIDGTSIVSSFILQTKQKKLAWLPENPVQRVIVPPVFSYGLSDVPPNWIIPWPAPSPASWHVECRQSCLRFTWPWAHCEACRWLEPAVMYIAVHFSGLWVVHPTWAMQLIASESLGSDLLLLLSILTAVLCVMLLMVSPTTSAFQERHFSQNCHIVLQRNFMFWAVKLNFLILHRWKILASPLKASLTGDVWAPNLNCIGLGFFHCWLTSLDKSYFLSS